MTKTLDALIDSNPHLWRGRQIPSAVDVLATGCLELDQALPHKGWPLGAVIELLLPAMGIGEVRLLLPAIVQVTCNRHYVLMINTPYHPYASVLSTAGVDLEYVLIVSPDRWRDALWSAEKALSNQACGMVLLWHGDHQKDARHQNNPQPVRRLQVAAQAGHSLLFLYRRTDPHQTAVLEQHSWSAVRLLLSAARNHLGIEILKARGGYKRGRIMVNLEDGPIQPGCSRLHTNIPSPSGRGNQFHRGQ